MGASQTLREVNSPLGPDGPMGPTGASRKRMEHELARRGVDVDTLSFSEQVEFAAEYGEQRAARRFNANSGLMDRVIGAGFAFVIGIIMLNFLFGIELVNNSSGPFADQLSTVENVIGAAIVLGALGILALAGYYARSMLGGM